MIFIQFIFLKKETQSRTEKGDVDLDGRPMNHPLRPGERERANKQGKEKKIQNNQKINVARIVCRCQSPYCGQTRTHPKSADSQSAKTTRFLRQIAANEIIR